MLNQCANTSCGKPLHYLREGRIFVFDMPDPAAAAGERTRRLQHFWLCGRCSETLSMELSSDKEIRVVVKKRKVTTGSPEVLPSLLAS